jgi:hypothetical protein
MTEHEYLLLKERMKTLALTVLLDWLVGLHRTRFDSLPAGERFRVETEVRKKLQAARQDYQSLAVPWLAPALSDLQCAEFQEAFDELSKKLEDKLVGAPS